uniref:Uncharacterized protein n=1 Tax=Salix viminalis TaxID=40686 RepID=A0A6N2L1R3_SALVM
MSNLDDMIPEIMEMVPQPKSASCSKEVVASFRSYNHREILAELERMQNVQFAKRIWLSMTKCKSCHASTNSTLLDEHNSCPICRHELQTDDHGYESWKEREKEAAEERRVLKMQKRFGVEATQLLPKHRPLWNWSLHLAILLQISQPIIIISSGTHQKPRLTHFFIHGFLREELKSRDLHLYQEWFQMGMLVEAAATLDMKMVILYLTNTNYKQRQKYTQMESCLVIPPPKGRKPRAIIKFLGGAFIGAVPEVTYSCLIELLAKNGYVVILVPYNVTFDHSQAANQVYERFNACLHLLLQSGLPHVGLTASELAGLPLFSVGHSNGALLQVLTGSYFSENIPKANAIISFNNRPATEAVPYFEQLGPLVNQLMPAVEASPMYAMARSASGDAWKVLLDTAGAIIPDSEQEALISLTKFVDQLPSVFVITQGISEFKPSPSENRDCCRNSYNVQHTLLVKFNSDAIDETDVLEETLKPRVESIGGTIEKAQLSGNHITPCIQDPKWQVGYVYTPVDAIAQGLKTLSLNETKVLSRTICDWFSCFED